MSITKPEEVQYLEQSPGSGQTLSSRNSDMSFKCLGEDQFIDEPIELSNSFNEKNPLDSRCLPQILAQNMPPNFAARGWVRRSISENIIEEDESTATSPPSTPQTSSQPIYESVATSPSSVPPRSSSFDQTRKAPTSFPFDINTQREHVPSQDDAILQRFGGNKQDSFDDSDSMPEDDYYTSPSTSSDEAQPAVNEQSTKYRVGTARVQSLFGNHNYHPVTGTLLPNPGDTALTVVEDLVRYFPFHPSIDFRSHISTVRTQLHLISSQRNQFSPGTALPHTERQPPEKKWSRARRLTASISSLTKFTNDNISSTSVFSSISDAPIYDPNAHIDLEPLQRIFPLADTTTIQPLYAYVLGYFLILETQSITRLNQRTQSLSKATRMLGVPLLPDKPPSANDHIDNLVFAKRIDSVITSLQNSIYCLVTAMDPDTGNRGGAWGFAESFMMRSLIELISNVEERTSLLVKFSHMH